MENQFERTELLFGKEAINKLKKSRVAIFGVGGVGGYVCEALARVGVGALDIIDNDTVSVSNINRQIIATHHTVGRLKVDVMEERILSINPSCKVRKYNTFALKDNLSDFPFEEYDYVVDAIDTVSGKLGIIKEAYDKNIPIISSMGAGNKLNPQGFIVADINKTEVDPLARTIRYEVRKLGIKHLKVVYSKEIPLECKIKKTSEETGKVIPGSNPFVPSSCGLLIASEVTKDLLK